MSAALASYPNLGCTAGPYEVATKFDDVLCPGNEDTYAFLETVFSELINIFPSEYIHIGGDECPKHRWQQCSKCQVRIKESGLHADNQHSPETKLQSYCISRIADFLKSRGRKVIGWDEILNGSVPAGSVIMSWHGLNGGIEGAKQGHDIIMTPNTHTYFDFYQTLNIENVPLAIGGYLPLEKVYSLEPVPTELTKQEQKHILGVQANMWTEYILSPQHLEYMLVPRVSALSEVQWTMPDSKDYNSFRERLLPMCLLYNKLGYNYAKHFMDIEAKLSTDTERRLSEISLTTFDNAPIYYTLDGSYPTTASQLYADKITVDKAVVLRAISIRPEGESLPYKQTFEFNKATFKPVSVNGYLDPAYTFSGEQALVDGLSGGKGYSDGNWLGFLGNKVVIILDLKDTTSVASVAIGTYVSVNDWIFGATGLNISVSIDGTHYRQVFDKHYSQAEKDHPVGRVDLIANFKTIDTRYIKMEITKTAHLPVWHTGSPSLAYLFVDEVVVY